MHLSRYLKIYVHCTVPKFVCFFQSSFGAFFGLELCGANVNIRVNFLKEIKNFKGTVS